MSDNRKDYARGHRHRPPRRSCHQNRTRKRGRQTAGHARTDIDRLPMPALLPIPTHPFWSDISYMGLRAMPVRHFIFSIRHPGLELFQDLENGMRLTGNDLSIVPAPQVLNANRLCASGSAF